MPVGKPQSYALIELIFHPVSRCHGDILFYSIFFGFELLSFISVMTLSIVNSKNYSLKSSFLNLTSMFP
jgi:hypothetical protein